jgi:glucose-6-phosphate dehydrogenase assembly protein OpcA
VEADLMPAAAESVWSAEHTSPAAIEEGLRELLQERHAGDSASAAARVLNLVAVVDGERREEIDKRLAQVGRYHPSRTIVCVVEPGHSGLDARATLTGVLGQPSGALGLCHERVAIEMGPESLRHLDVIVDPILISELTTVVWAPHGHQEAVDALLRLANVILLDSTTEADDIAVSLDRVSELAGRAYVVDLAWLRSTPWRERIAATLDPMEWGPALQQISAVTVRHRNDSAVSGLLLVGWLASRLGWKAAALERTGTGIVSGRASDRDRDVHLTLESVEDLEAPGLAGVTVETTSGLEVSLDRAPGGLAATRRTPDGRRSQWTVLGASRGEGGILGEGIRQALLRDPTYRPALSAARSMCP